MTEIEIEVKKESGVCMTDYSAISVSGLTKLVRLC
jgi:hypothetical protein